MNITQTQKQKLLHQLFGSDAENKDEIRITLDTAVHDTKAHEATTINNAGIDDQLDYLLIQPAKTQRLPSEMHQHQQVASTYMVFWEYVIESKNTNIVLRRMFEKHGTCEMRDIVARDTDKVMSVLDNLNHNIFAGTDPLLIAPFDWELIPMVLQIFYSDSWNTDDALICQIVGALAKLVHDS